MFFHCSLAPLTCDHFKNPNNGFAPMAGRLSNIREYLELESGDFPGARQDILCSLCTRVYTNRRLQRFNRRLQTKFDFSSFAFSRFQFLTLLLT